MGDEVPIRPHVLNQVILISSSEDFLLKTDLTNSCFGEVPNYYYRESYTSCVMSYEITDGIAEADLKPWLENALRKYGLYEGKAVNYTDADVAPIIMCTVIVEDEILLAKRGYGLADAEGYWSTINGFIDEVKPVAEFAQQECLEELGLAVEISQIKVVSSYTLKNPKEKRRYIVFPCLVELDKKPEIRLDREHTDFRWIKRAELETYDILDDLPVAIDAALSVR